MNYTLNSLVLRYVLIYTTMEDLPRQISPAELGVAMALVVVGATNLRDKAVAVATQEDMVYMPPHV